MHLSLTEKYQQVLENDQEPQVHVGPSGVKQWRLDNGVLHRVDGPAVEWPTGAKEWYIYGIRHRPDGPAVEGPRGHKEWYVLNKRHRTDGPAIEWPNGAREWLVNDRYHRLDGPAIEYGDGTYEWWIDGREYRKEKFDEYVNKLKEIEKGSEEAGANLDF